jgi:hypothetical protein
MRRDDVGLLRNQPIPRTQLQSQSPDLQVLTPQHSIVQHAAVLQFHVLQLQHSNPATTTRTTTPAPNNNKKQSRRSIERDF